MFGRFEKRCEGVESSTRRQVHIKPAESLRNINVIFQVSGPDPNGISEDGHPEFFGEVQQQGLGGELGVDNTVSSHLFQRVFGSREPPARWKEMKITIIFTHFCQNHPFIGSAISFVMSSHSKSFVSVIHFLFVIMKHSIVHHCKQSKEGGLDFKLNVSTTLIN